MYYWCGYYITYEHLSCFNSYMIELKFKVHRSVHRKNIPIYISNKMQFYTVYFIWKLLYMFRVVPPPIIRSAKNRDSGQVAVTVWQIPDVVNTVVCDPDDGWRYHPKHLEQFPDINKLCKFASCWIYIGIYWRFTDPWMLNLINYSCHIKWP